MLMGAIIAALFYWIFFGTVSLNGDETVGKDASGFYFKSHWDGILTYASRAIETPISQYYYLYCYLPTAYNNLYVDVELSKDSSGTAKILGYNNFLDLSSLPSNLENESTELYNDTLKSSDKCKYSTGFY